MLDQEKKCSLIEATEGLKAGMFVHIHGYVSEHGEIQHATVHADAQYDSVYKRSAKQLDVIEKDTNLKLEINRNTWVDSKGTEYNRKAKDRTLKTGIKETVTPADPDFVEAIAKVRKSIVDPKTTTDNMVKIGNSIYDNPNTDRTYLRNVLIHSKTIVQQGDYPISCQARVNAITDTIRKMLPIAQYRTYILDANEKVIVKVIENGAKIEKMFPRFEYVSLMGAGISSSSSEE